MTLIDWSSSVALYCAIAGSLAGFIFTAISIFLSKANVKGTKDILMFLASALYGFISASFLYGEALEHIPKGSGLHAWEYSTFNCVSTMAGCIFAISVTQLFLCLAHLYKFWNAEPDAVNFATKLVWAVIAIAVAQISVAIDYSLRIRMTEHFAASRIETLLKHPSIHFIFAVATILVSSTVWWLIQRRQTLWEGHARTLANGTFKLTTFLLVVPASYLADSGTVPWWCYLVGHYGLAVFLGGLLTSCLLACPTNASKLTNNTSN